MGKGTILHVSVAVRGMLRWPKIMLRGAFKDPKTGRYLTADEAREHLMDLLASGVEVLPFAGEACVGFDPKKGCPGHRPPGDEDLALIAFEGEGGAVAA